MHRDGEWRAGSCPFSRRRPGGPARCPVLICRGLLSPGFLPSQEGGTISPHLGARTHAHRWGRNAPARRSPAPGSSRPRLSPRSDAARRQPRAGAPPPCCLPGRPRRPGRFSSGLLCGVLRAWVGAGASGGHDRAGTFPDGSGCGSPARARMLCPGLRPLGGAARDPPCTHTPSGRTCSRRPAPPRRGWGGPSMLPSCPTEPGTEAAAREPRTQSAELGDLQLPRCGLSVS